MRRKTQLGRLQNQSTKHFKTRANQFYSEFEKIRAFLWAFLVDCATPPPGGRQAMKILEKTQRSAELPVKEAYL